MEKRGQITIFFIVGLIVLIVIGGYFALKYLVFEKRAEIEVVKKGEIPAKIKPLADFLDGCLEDVSKEGVDIIASQGGYIDIEEDSMPITPFTPIGRSIEIIPNLKTAVWFRERGNSIFEYNIPSKAIMEKQLKEYINRNFLKCLASLDNFAYKGYLLGSTAASFNTKVTILDEIVNVEVNFPIDIKYEDVSFTIKNHIASIKKPIGRLYDTAVEIMNSENQNNYFGNKTLDMLIAYDPEIPFSSVDTSCEDKIWSKVEVIKRVKEALEANSGAMKIKGTDYKLTDSKFEFMELDMLSDPDDDININLMYSRSWPTFIDINPSNGDVLRSESFASGKGGLYTQILTQFMCLNEYRFIYDLKYPLLVSLSDDKGNRFQFVAEVIIDNNQPRKNTNVPIEPVVDTSEIICKYAQSNVFVSTYTFDSFGNSVPLNGVDISFKCMPATCSIGRVISEGSGLVKAPSCFNGVLVGKKDGYYEGKSILTTKSGQEYYESLYLEPVYKKNVKIKMVDKYSKEIRDPYESEEVFFEFSANNKTYREHYTYPDQSSVSLIAGDYHVKAYVLRESTWPITTQTKTVKHCITTAEANILGAIGLASQTNCIDSEIESMKMDQVITGGVEFDYWFERQYLADGSTLVLYVPVDAVPSSMEEIADIQNKIDVNKYYPLFRYPEYE